MARCIARIFASTPEKPRRTLRCPNQAEGDTKTCQRCRDNQDFLMDLLRKSGERRRAEAAEVAG